MGGYMKNAINYNLYPINLYQNQKMYKFTVDNKDYFFVPYKRDINNLELIYKLHEILNQYNIYCHKIVLNINNEISTNINNKSYVLLESKLINDEPINLKNIFYYQIVTPNLHLENIISPRKWRDLWINKVDYFEYQVLSYKKKYPLVSITSSYYIGLAENAIQLLYNQPEINDYCISHHRILNDYTLFDLYNPLEFIIDKSTRDITEFFKIKFFNDELKFEDIFNYININLKNNEDAIFFLSRMIYPSYYFDLCEKIIYENINENELSIVLDRANNYEKFLKKIYHILSDTFIIPNIEWLKEIKYL